MNAFNTVNLAAACILTSVEHAETLGIPKENWVYVLGGAGTGESSNCKSLLPKPLVCKLISPTYTETVWERPNYFSSPAVSQSIDSALSVSALTKDDVDCFDFYS